MTCMTRRYVLDYYGRNTPKITVTSSVSDSGAHWSSFFGPDNDAWAFGPVFPPVRRRLETLFNLWCYVRLLRSHHDLEWRMCHFTCTRVASTFSRNIIITLMIDASACVTQRCVHVSQGETWRAPTDTVILQLDHIQLIMRFLMLRFR